MHLQHSRSRHYLCGTKPKKAFDGRVVPRLALVFLVSAVPACSNETPLSPANNTFILTGLIQDAASVPVAGAIVQVSSGSLAGRTATTDASGRFEFNEQFSSREQVTLSIFAAGYLPANVPISRTNIVVTLTTSKLEIEGDYAITFRAADHCAATLPATVRRRSYSAKIAVWKRLGASLDGSFSIELSGADFFPGLRTPWLSISGDIGTFFVASLEAMERWGDDVGFYERLGANDYVSFHGVGKGTVPVNSTTFDTTWDGVVSYCGRVTNPLAPGFPPECVVAGLDCRSNRHQVAGSRH